MRKSRVQKIACELNLRDESKSFTETVAGGPLMEAKGL